MEFHEKLQELRKQRNLTQEELAEKLFVSRTAVSKWESGRGYPGIDSLKAVSLFFSISLDDLLSGNELIMFAEKDSLNKMEHMRDLVFGLLDCALVLLFFVPLFGQRQGDFIAQVSLLSLTEIPLFLKTAYLTILALTISWGIATLALQNHQNAVWGRWKRVGSLVLSIFAIILFIASLQPYVASVLLVLLVIKGILLIKRQ